MWRNAGAVRRRKLRAISLKMHYSEKQHSGALDPYADIGHAPDNMGGNRQIGKFVGIESLDPGWIYAFFLRLHSNQRLSRRQAWMPLPTETGHPNVPVLKKSQKITKNQIKNN